MRQEGEMLVEKGDEARVKSDSRKKRLKAVVNKTTATMEGFR